MGLAAAAARITLLELTELTASLEDAYMALTGESVESFRSGRLPSVTRAARLTSEGLQ